MQRSPVPYHRESFPVQMPRRVRASSGYGRTDGLQRDILKTLIYFDMFDHPLRLAEIHQFLPSNSVPPKELHQKCLFMLLHRQLEEKDGYFALPGRAARLADMRIEKERYARRMWIVARFVTGIIRRFPFVRGVFVSGELSKGVAAKGSDIDFFIVTAERRVWIVRAICTVFKVVFLFNQKKFFCYNHIASEEHLEIEERNFYTAVESVTLKPIFNDALYEKFYTANSWTKEYLPAAPCPVQKNKKFRTVLPLVERIVVALLSPELLDRIEHCLLGQWRVVWDRRYPGLTLEKRAQLFRCTPHLSTAYTRDFLERILLQYGRRLSEFGLEAQG